MPDDATVPSVFPTTDVIPPVTLPAEPEPLPQKEVSPPTIPETLPVKEPTVMAPPPMPAPTNGSAPPIDASRIQYWLETQEIIKKIEAAVNSRVITFFIPMSSSLTISDVQNVYYHLEKIGKQEKIALLLFGPGGNGIAAYRLVKLMRNYTSSIIGIVPDNAASAMTMLSLGADVLMTGPLTTFSAIDSSLANHPLAPQAPDGYPVSVEITQIGKFLEMVKSDTYDKEDFNKGAYKALVDKVHPLLLGAIQRAFSLSKRLTTSILKTHLSDEKQIDTIVNTLNDEFPTHSYPVLPEDLQQMGLKTVSMAPELNRLCTDLLDFYRIYADGSNRVDGNKKVSWTRQSIIESTGFRTWYYSEGTYMLNDKNEWKRSASFGDYMHAGEILTQQGFIKVDRYSPKQFKNWMNGEKVTVTAE